MVGDEKATQQAESIDEFELENRVSSEDERKVHNTMISYEKERLGTQRSEVGEGSGVEQHNVTPETLMPTQPETTPAVDHRSIPAYNPDQSQLPPVQE